MNRKIYLCRISHSLWTMKKVYGQPKMRQTRALKKTKDEMKVLLLVAELSSFSSSLLSPSPTLVSSSSTVLASCFCSALSSAFCSSSQAIATSSSACSLFSNIFRKTSGISSSRRGSSSLMWTSKPGISRVHTAKSSFPTRSRLMLVVTEEVKRPLLFSEDVENVSPSRATKLSVHARERLGAGKASVARQVRMIKSSVAEVVEVNTREEGGT